MANNVAVGILRPPRVFFYEVDVKKGKFRATKKRLIEFAKKKLVSFSIYRTLHGYHVRGYPFKRSVFIQFCHSFRSDFARKLRPRWKRRNPQVLRISEKFDLKTGKIVSPKPKLIYGNFFLGNIQNYKVLYYAK